MTGVEEEDVVYKARAKLLRFVGSKLRERGVGEVKLLQHRRTGKVRVVMRRDKVHKLCLNHLISESIILHSMPSGMGKIWIWQASDFSESADSPSHETFAIRFMTEDAASLFKNAVDAAKSTERKPPVESDNRASLLAKLLTSQGEESDSDIDFVGEELPSPGKVNVARSYRLPDTFYNYEKHTDCPGCLGCIEPPFDFSKIGQAGVYVGMVAQQGRPKVDKREPETSKASSPPASCMFGAAGGLVDLASLASGSTNDMLSTKKTDELDSDIDFEGEELPSPGKVKAARSYRLPDTFYNYEKHTDCPGCLGCIEPPFDFSKIGQAGVYVGMVAQQGKAAANIADTKMITNEVDSSAASASVPPSVPAAAVSSVESSTPVSVPACQPTTAPFSFTRPSTLRGLQQKDDSLCLQY